eukprot:gb/GEZN01000042.1/.p1 GENE.gb/GEZN01000042.1/~~gb/GEZN01000042.1/.p1  ORF type:complete len:1572 (-),score=435.64 gb/GEZN01000042.1/:1139-5854(-)
MPCWRMIWLEKSSEKSCGYKTCSTSPSTKKITDFAARAKTYLEKKDDVDSVTQAQLNLATMQEHKDERKIQDQEFADLKTQGAALSSAEYKTALSQYKFPTPEEIVAREKEMEDAFVALTEQATKKHAVLEDDLTREEFRENLRQRNVTHTDKHKKLTIFIAASHPYLDTKEAVNSIQQAKENLSRLSEYLDERKVNDSNNVILRALGDEIKQAEYKTALSQYKFPTPQEVDEREANVESEFEALTKKAAKKTAVLEDDLAREIFREKLRQQNLTHVDKHKTLAAFIAASHAYLDVKEPVDSIQQAKENLGRMSEYLDERKVNEGINVILRALGDEIKKAEYKTTLSQYKFPTPKELDDREANVATEFKALEDKAAKKKAVLEDDLAREIFREKLRLQNLQHIAKHKKITDFAARAKTYLEKKDDVDSVTQAQLNLATMQEHKDERKIQDQDFADLKTQGAALSSAEYKTALSQHKFPTPEEIMAREKEVENAFTALTEQAAKKCAVLEDDLKREEFREALRQRNLAHIDKHKKLVNFIAASHAYLEVKEPVDSIKQAKENLGRMNEYLDERKVNDGVNVILKSLGSEIKQAEYKTTLSQYKFPTTNEIDEREANVETEFKALADKASRKKAVLEDDLAREEFREKLRLQNLQHIAKHKKITDFAARAKTYLEMKDEVDSVTQAQLNLATMQEHKDERKIQDQEFADLKTQGAALSSAEYKTVLSQHKFPTPGEIAAREKEVENAFAALTEKAVKKHAVLEDDLKREEFREALVQDNLVHIVTYDSCVSFVTPSLVYLRAVDPVNSIVEAQVNISRLEAFFEEEKDFEVRFETLQKLGAEIRAKEYKSALSSYKFETPEEIVAREHHLQLNFLELDLLSGVKREKCEAWGTEQASKLPGMVAEDQKLNAAANVDCRAALTKMVEDIKAKKFSFSGKLGVLEDDLAREKFKARVRGWNLRHKDGTEVVETWGAESKAYLATKAVTASIEDAEKALAKLRAFETDKANKQKVNQTELKKLGGEIQEAEYKTNLSSWKLETPEEVTTRLQAVEGMFQELDKLTQSREQVSEDDLAREQFKESLRRKAQKHQDSFDYLLQFGVALGAKFEAKVEVKSVSDAIGHLLGHKENVTNMEATKNIAVTKLEKLGAEILAADYKTELSAYKFEQPQEIQKRQNVLGELWVKLGQQAAAKQQDLESALAVEQSKEKARLAFANCARETFIWVQAQMDECASTQFGTTMQEVKAFEGKLDAEDPKMETELKEKQTAFEKVNSEVESLKVVENRYTTHTFASLKELVEQGRTAIKSRRERYKAALEELKANDALCQAFAAKAQKFDEQMKATKAKVSGSTLPLDGQLNEVLLLEQNFTQDKSIEEVKQAQAAVEAAKIRHNPHTVLSLADIDISVQQLGLFLSKKRDFLQVEIEHQNLRGISKEQYQEIEAQFVQFDKSKNGQLEMGEFRACLYSLGEDLGRKKVQAIMDTYAKTKDAACIKRDEFKEYMITHLGVTDTKENILEAFKDIAAGNEKTIRKGDIVPRRAEVFLDTELKWFQTQAESSGNDTWDYVAFTEAVFSR